MSCVTNRTWKEVGERAGQPDWMFPFCKFLLWQRPDMELRGFPAHAIPFLFCLPLLGNSHRPPGMFGSGRAHCSARRPSHEGRKGLSC
jgi:hypothetical protein